MLACPKKSLPDISRSWPTWQWDIAGGLRRTRSQRVAPKFWGSLAGKSPKNGGHSWENPQTLERHGWEHHRTRCFYQAKYGLKRQKMQDLWWTRRWTCFPNQWKLMSFTLVELVPGRYKPETPTTLPLIWRDFSACLGWIVGSPMPTSWY